MKNMSAVITEDELVYIWGSCSGVEIKEPIPCEYTSIFNVINVLRGKQPFTTNRTFVEEEKNILIDLEAAFNNIVSFLYLLCFSVYSFYLFLQLVRLQDTMVFSEKNSQDLAIT